MFQLPFQSSVGKARLSQAGCMHTTCYRFPELQLTHVQLSPSQVVVLVNNIMFLWAIVQGLQ